MTDQLTPDERALHGLLMLAPDPPRPALAALGVAPSMTPLRSRVRYRRAIPALMGVLLTTGISATAVAAYLGRHSGTAPTASTPTPAMSLAPPTSGISPLPPSPSASVVLSPSSSVAPTGAGAPTFSPTPASISPPLGWPGPSNTGVPVGTTLAGATGDVVLSTANGVYDAHALTNGCITVKANNVTISRVLVRGYRDPCGAAGLLIEVMPGVTGTVVRDSEIDGAGGQIIAIGGGSITCLRCNIHGTTDGIGASGGLVQDSWIHDLVAHSSSGGGSTGLYFEGPANGMTIRHNTIDDNIYASAAAPVYISPDSGPVTNISIDNNLLSGGRYCLDLGVGVGTYGSSTAGIVVNSNHFSRLRQTNCGLNGTDIHYASSPPGNSWSGNVWDDSGATVFP